MKEAVESLLPYKTQALDDSSVLADTVTLLEAVLSFACQHQTVILARLIIFFLRVIV